MSGDEALSVEGLIKSVLWDITEILETDNTEVANGHLAQGWRLVTMQADPSGRPHYFLGRIDALDGAE